MQKGPNRAERRRLHREQQARKTGTEQSPKSPPEIPMATGPTEKSAVQYQADQPSENLGDGAPKNPYFHNLGDSIAIGGTVLGGWLWIVLPTITGKTVALVFVVAGLIYLCQKSYWVRNLSLKKRSVVSSVAAALFLSAGIYQLTTQWEQEHLIVAPQSLPIDTDLHISINYLRTDWDKPYSPKTLFMAYYLLNNHPFLSPIDIWVNISVSNSGKSPKKIDLWSIETAPSPSGPWITLHRIPSGNHMNIVLIGSLKNKRASKFIFNDINDAFKAPISPGNEVRGWMLGECISAPPCLGWYERITLVDADKKTYPEIISLSDYNSALQRNRTDENEIGVNVLPVRRCSI